MTAELATAGPADTIEFSNVTVVRDREGQLSVYVGAEKMLGTMGVNIGNGALALGVPMSRVRIMEDIPATPVLEYKDNIIIGNFAKFREAQAVSPTEGDVA
jgi:hypothetical protein